VTTRSQNALFFRNSSLAALHLDFITSSVPKLM
jgi:hypothetical protein